MNLKNYTSSVPVDQSITYIERLLVQAGASQIAKLYDANGDCTGMKFQMEVNGVPLLFKLPSDVKPIEEYMLAQVRKMTSERERTIKQQAGRTAWKMLHEWVHIQVSQIETKRLKPLQVFLAYLWNPKDGKTYFEMLEENKFKQLNMAKAE